MNMKDKIVELFNTWLEEETEDFSGVLSATGIDGVIHQQTFGFRNKAKELPNETDTAFGIASGTKLFTGLAVCKLIDGGKLSLEDKLCDLLTHDLGQIDKRVTVYQLLTHTSGAGDYIDEDAEDFDEQLAALYEKYPSQNWLNMDYYLQMTAPLAPKFAPGEEYSYSNSGYVLLGLVIEAVSGKSYQQFVADEIIKPCGLTHTGFYRSNALPDNAAIGYMEDEESEKWHTNVKNIPILGGSDGGIYSCAADMDKLWRAIFSNKILSDKMTALFLKSHEVIEEDEDDGSVESYGLGVYKYAEDDKYFHFVIGIDSGVGFCSAYYPATQVVVSAFSNTGETAFYDLMCGCIELLG